MSLDKLPPKIFKVLASESIPKWDVLRRHIRQQVLSGEFMPGDILPSEMVLCKQFGMARITVRHALDELEREGIIERIKGKGTFVSHARLSEPPLRTTNVFCLVMPETRRDVYPQLISGFSEGASKINYQVMIVITHNEMYREGDIMLQVMDKKMAGVALVPILEKVTPPHHIRQLQSNEIPVVLCNRPVEGVSAPLVAWDYKEIGRIAAGYLLERGHRRIGYFGNIRHPMTEAHVKGLEEALLAAGCAMRPEDVIFSGTLADSDQDRCAVIEEKLSRPDRPTAILCNDDTEAENVLWTAGHIGLKVPDDLAVVGFGVSTREGMYRKQLTSVLLDASQIGKKAIELLAEMRSGKRSITSDEVFHVDLGFVQGSTA